MERNRNWREIWENNLWAVKLWWSIDPKLFFSTAFPAIVEAVTPYITVWLSAQIINELSGARDPQTLWKWVILTVSVTAGLRLLKETLYHWKGTVHSLENFYEEKLMADKMMDMDFAAAESPETKNLRFQWTKQSMGNAYGFEKIHTWYCEKLVGGVASVLGAAALSFSLFTQQVPDGAWTVLNSGWVSCLVILLLLSGAILAPMLLGKSAARNHKRWPYYNRFARAWNAYATLGLDTRRCVDIRMYNQQEMATEVFQENQEFDPGSPVSKLFYRELGPLDASSSAVSVVLIGFSYLFVCLKAWAGAFGIGSVTQYVGAVTNLCGGLSELLRAAGDLPQNTEYLKAIRAYLDIPNDMYQGTLPTEKRDDREYEIEFRDVSFRYPGADAWALRHVNMKFKVGSRLAVVGMNGSGKTTFIKLLCRLYEPTEGEIRLNGIDIRKYQQEDYRALFSVVFQDFRLAALPLGENVAAAAAYDRDLAKICLRGAGFGQRLEELPKGLDTYLYKDMEKTGVEVSGGEAQKIALARALYKDAPFIILDEPTAALDPMAEAEIYEKFDRIAGDKTAVYISHRLSSCKFCDEIAVFHEGAVVQQGSHESLLAECDGKYYELWHAQAQYYTHQ